MGKLSTCYCGKKLVPLDGVLTFDLGALRQQCSTFGDASSWACVKTSQAVCRRKGSWGSNQILVVSKGFH